MRPTNCALCNKAFKYKKWFYRNGKYFCTKRCWKKFNDEKKKEGSEKAARETEAKEAAKKVTEEQATKDEAPAKKEVPEKPAEETDTPSQ